MNFSTSLKIGAHITGVGVVGGFGSGAAALLAALEKGEPAGQVVVLSHPNSGEDGVDCRALKADTAEVERFMPKRALRRIDHYSRLALLGAHLALEDAGVDHSAPLGERVALVIASGHGAVGSTFSFLDSMIEDGDSHSSPTHFSNSVHNSAAAYISMRLGITGPNLTVSQQSQSVTSALAGALGFLAEGDADAVLFGAVDEVSPVYSFENSDLQGEGAAFFWLVRPEVSTAAGATNEEGSKSYGEVELLRIDEDVARGVAADIDLLYGENLDDSQGEGVRFVDTTGIHGECPTRSALDLAACAVGAVEGERCGVVERQGESCAVALVHRRPKRG